MFCEVNNDDFIFKKIKIIKQNTLLSKNEFYYFILKDLKNNIKVAKWLTKINGKLYTKDVIDSGDLFEQSYLVCVGEDDCLPQVFESDSIKQWGCSEDVICYINEEEAEKQALKCKSYKMIIQN